MYFIRFVLVCLCASCLEQAISKKSDTFTKHLAKLFLNLNPSIAHASRKLAHASQMSGGKGFGGARVKVEKISADNITQHTQDIQTLFDAVNTFQLQFDQLSFQKLHDIKSNVQIANSTMREAGLGLVATRDLDPGVVVGLYPVHAVGRSDTNGGESCCTSKDDASYFGSQEGSVYSCSLGELHSGGEGMFVDVNPNKETHPCWQGHRINDAARCNGSSPLEVSAYDELALSRRNCVPISFGPLPLLAFATSRAVRAGEELLTRYGPSHWTKASKARVVRTRQDHEKDQYEYNRIVKLVAQSYATDLTELERIFPALIKHLQSLGH